MATRAPDQAPPDSVEEDDLSLEAEAEGDEPEEDASEGGSRRVRLLRRKPKKKVRLRRRAAEAEADPGQEPELEEEGAQEWADTDEEGTRRLVRNVVDAIVPDLVKRVVAAGGEALSEESIKRIVSEASLPRASVSGLRGEFQRVLSREIRGFLDTVDISGELQKILTSMTFEIRTEVRFVPNEDKVKPKIKNRVRVRRGSHKEQADKDPA